MEVFLYRALYVSLCLTFVESTANYQLFKGPKTGETQRYQVCPMLSQPCSHCFYCEDGVLSDSTYEYKQDVLCNQYYIGKNMSEAFLPEELANNKIPLCNIGQVPGCGPPPQDNIQPGLSWKCDPGHSNQPHSVYFSCALICNYTNTVAYQYYCNESLRWELLEATNSSCRSNVSEEVLTSIEAGTAWIVPTIVGIIVVAGVLIVAVSCLIYHKRKKEDERVRNGELDECVSNGDFAPNDFSNINNLKNSKKETAQIEMSVINGNDSIQAVLQDEHETDLKTLDYSEISGQDTSANMSLLTGKINNVTNKDKPASKCTLSKIFKGKKNSEPTSCIKICFKIVNGKLKWEKCVDVNGVFEIPSGAEEIRIFINPKQAKDLCVEKEAGPNTTGQYDIGKTQFVISSKTEDCNGKYCCKYKLILSQEEMTEHFEIKHLIKKVNNTMKQPEDNSIYSTLNPGSNSIYSTLNPGSLVSKDSGLSSIKGAKCISSYTSPKSSRDPCKSWNDLSVELNTLDLVEEVDEKTQCLTNS
ncbi:uncharacterized protein LOC127879171 [Dreissena polymorpha]|nr:uncharacterized protein LOC127879171 [Dreissena polymorpha]